MNTIFKRLTRIIAAVAVTFSIATPALLTSQVAYGLASTNGVNFRPTEAQDDCETDNPDSSNCEIIRYLLIFINGLSAIVGVTIVAVIVMAGIKYASSADDPNAVADAKNRIKNAIFAFVMYIFMFAFLQWIVPGGVL